MSDVTVENAEEAVPVSLRDAQRAALREMVKSATARGEAVTGPNGLLADVTKLVVEIALDEEMTEHLGYSKHDPEGRDGGNSRNGVRSKTVLTENAGPVEIDVPRDRDGSFTPVVVSKRQRRLGSVDEVILSLYARGMTTGDISAHFARCMGRACRKPPCRRSPSGSRTRWSNGRLGRWSRITWPCSSTPSR